MPFDPTSRVEGLLVLPFQRVQNANTFAGQHTWGWPAITNFTGFMTALARKLGPKSGLEFHGVGVVAHGYQTQVYGGFIKKFVQPRHPLNKHGTPPPIIEEGRIHLDLTLVFGVSGKSLSRDAEGRDALAADILEVTQSMRLAGGSFVEPVRIAQPRLIPLPADEDRRVDIIRQVRRSWLPGFALVSRDAVLDEHLAHLSTDDSQATRLDAWLDLSRLNFRPIEETTAAGEEGAVSEVASIDDDSPKPVEWRITKSSLSGWIVPIAVGYGAVSRVVPPGYVENSRDKSVPFALVESLYSMGEWLSPRRLANVKDLLWYPDHDQAAGVYRCRNHYQPAVPVPFNETEAAGE